MINCQNIDYIILNTGYTSNFLDNIKYKQFFLKKKNKFYGIYPELICADSEFENYGEYNTICVFNNDCFKIIKNIVGLEKLENSIVFKFNSTLDDADVYSNFDDILKLIKIIGNRTKYKYCVGFNTENLVEMKQISNNNINILYLSFDTENI